MPDDKEGDNSPDPSVIFEDGGDNLPSFEPAQANKLMKNIAQLEGDLDSEKEERKEERFLWVLAIAVLIAIIAAQAINAFWPFLLIFLLMLIGLLGFAKKMGVDWAVQLLGWLLNWITNKLKPDNNP